MNIEYSDNGPADQAAPYRVQDNELHEAVENLRFNKWFHIDRLTPRQATDLKAQLLIYQGTGRPIPWRVVTGTRVRPEPPVFFGGREVRLVDLWVQKIPWTLSDSQRDYLEPFIPALNEAYGGGKRSIVATIRNGSEYQDLFHDTPVREAYDRYLSGEY